MSLSGAGTASATNGGATRGRPRRTAGASTAASSRPIPTTAGGDGQGPTTGPTAAAITTATTTSVAAATSTGKRGRPESLVRQYWQDIDADGVGPKCIFCEHRSQTKVFRAPPATRHTLICKNAPDDVKERLKRLTNNKYSRRELNLAPSSTSPSHQITAAEVAAAAVAAVVIPNPPDHQHQLQHNQQHPQQQQQQQQQQQYEQQQPQGQHLHHHGTHAVHNSLPHTGHVRSPTTPVNARQQQPLLPPSTASSPTSPPQHHPSSQRHSHNTIHPHPHTAHINSQNSHSQSQSHRQQQLQPSQPPSPPPPPPSLSPPRQPPPPTPIHSQPHHQQNIPHHHPSRSAPRSTSHSLPQTIPATSTVSPPHQQHRNPPPTSSSTQQVHPFNFKRTADHAPPDPSIPSLSPPQNHAPVSSSAIIDTPPPSNLNVPTSVAGHGDVVIIRPSESTSLRPRPSGSPSSPSRGDIENLSPDDAVTAAVAAAAAVAATNAGNTTDIMYGNSTENKMIDDVNMNNVGRIHHSQHAPINRSNQHHSNSHARINNNQNNHHHQLIPGSGTGVGTGHVNFVHSRSNGEDDEKQNRTPKTRDHMELERENERDRDGARENAELVNAVIESMFSGVSGHSMAGVVPTPAEFRNALHDVKEIVRAKAKRQRNEARAETSKLQQAISVLVQTRPVAAHQTTSNAMAEVDSEESGDDEVGASVGVGGGVMNVNAIGGGGGRRESWNNGGHHRSNNNHYLHQKHQKHRAYDRK